MAIVKVMLVSGLVVCLAICLVACATAPGIVQDKPSAPSQCFEGPFSIYRLNSEPWEVVVADPPFFVVKNPVKGGQPCAVAMVISPQGQVLRFGYVDSGRFRSFMYSADKDCYLEEKISPELAEQGLNLLLKICGEKQC
jgi:hypothetical protein